MEHTQIDLGAFARPTGTLARLQARLPTWMTPLFFLTVFGPTLLAVVYFGVVASDVYVSEARYIVRTQGRQVPTGLASLLAGAGGADVGGSAMSAVAEYALSRDAMNALNKSGRLTQAYTRPEIDPFNRLSYGFGTPSSEDLHHYFTSRVALSQESQSSITTLVVKAYRPEDSRWINERLLQLGENLVNELNERSRVDLVRYATEEVEVAKQQSREAASKLAAFRNRYGIIDPEQQAEVSLTMVSKLQDEVIQTKAQLSQLQNFAPQNPQIPVLRNRIVAFEREIDDELRKVAGGRSSLAAKSAEYTRLALEAEYADKLLANALASLQNASNDARRQQVYIERIVQPNLPDEPTEPRRVRGILSVFVLGLAAWGVLSLLLSATREHNL
jgi:capsular polysaccharide transport system permease protein